MNYTSIFYLGPEHTVSGYYGDYRLSPGKVTVESWMADILLDHGFGLSLNPGKEAESYERRNKKHNGKGKAGHREIIREGGELNVKLDNGSILQ